MIPQSNAYRSRVMLDGRTWRAKAKITLANGTVLNVSDDRIMSGGVEIDAGVSQSGSLAIGTANVAELKLRLDNQDGTLGEYDFDMAKIEPSVGLVLSDSSTEYVQKGIYNVDDPAESGSVITLTALDRMALFDRDFAGCNCTFPATLRALLTACCTDCGVPQKTITFCNDTYTVPTKPEDCTYRDVIACIAQLSGCFARITYDGKLELAWYDYSRFDAAEECELDGDTDSADGNTDSVSGGALATGLQAPVQPVGVSARTVGTDDMVITGVKIVPQDSAITPVVCGTADYMIVIQNNPLVQSDPSSLAAVLGAKLIGFAYRTAEVTAMADPAVEPGDIMYVTDKAGAQHRSIVSRISYKIGASESYYADGETTTQKRTQLSTEGAKAVAIANAYTRKVETLSTLLGGLMANALGTYQTVQTLADGSQVLYQHDQPTLEASATIWKKTADAFAVSTDHGQTWNAGLSADGNLVVKLLEAQRIQSPVDDSVYIDLVNGDIGAKTLRSGNTDSYVMIGTDGMHGRGNQSEGIYLYRDDIVRCMLASQPNQDALAAFMVWLQTQGDLWISAADSSGADPKPVRIRLERATDNTAHIAFEVDGSDRGYIDTDGYHGWVTSDKLKTNAVNSYDGSDAKLALQNGNAYLHCGASGSETGLQVDSSGNLAVLSNGNVVGYFNATGYHSAV